MTGEVSLSGLHPEPILLKKGSTPTFGPREEGAANVRELDFKALRAVVEKGRSVHSLDLRFRMPGVFRAQKVQFKRMWAKAGRRTRWHRVLASSRRPARARAVRANVLRMVALTGSKQAPAEQLSSRGPPPTPSKLVF